MSGVNAWVRRAVLGVAVGAGVLAMAPAAKAQVVVGGSVGVYRPGVSVGVTFGQPPVVAVPVAPVVPVVPAYGYRYPAPVYRPYPAPVYGVPAYGGYYPRPYPHSHGYPGHGYPGHGGHRHW